MTALRSATQSASTYTLGSSPAELARLQRQGDYYAESTEMAMRQAGLTAGMHVIDAGSGAGDVAFLAADLVGPSGSVTGIEQSTTTVNSARERANSAGYANVAFVEGDVELAQLGGLYDALVGRFILMHTRQPVVALRNLTANVRPGAPVLFLEMDILAATARPHVALLNEMRDLICAAFAANGVDPAPGWNLRAQFLEAGLDEPSLHYLGRLDPAPAVGNCMAIAGVLRSLLPIIEASGLARAGELQLDTLPDRLAVALGEQGAQIMNPPLVAAIGYKQEENPRLSAA